MKNRYLFVITGVLVLATLFAAGCTQTTQQQVVVTTAPPTTTETPTATPTISACGIENCHGYTLQCGPNIASACTSDIDAGDRCRKYASCQVVSGTCQVVKETKYDKCVGCVKQCESTNYNNPNQLNDCADRCP
ncbi:MAG: hypothetical protein PHD55_05105 [Methanoregula sp.]|jgi:phage-related protein|nr:hypothetical protein [Methanoregula sp.]